MAACQHRHCYNRRTDWSSRSRRPVAPWAPVKVVLASQAATRQTQALGDTIMCVERCVHHFALLYSYAARYALIKLNGWSTCASGDGRSVSSTWQQLPMYYIKLWSSCFPLQMQTLITCNMLMWRCYGERNSSGFQRYQPQPGTGWLVCATWLLSQVQCGYSAELIELLHDPGLIIQANCPQVCHDWFVGIVEEWSCRRAVLATSWRGQSTRIASWQSTTRKRGFHFT